MTETFTTQTGRYDLVAEVNRAGEDVVVTVTGGAAHLGAAAAAAPRPSLRNPAQTGADVSSIAFTGHKEDGLARKMARRLAAGLGVKVVVAAGCHWDDLDEAGIEAVLTNAEELTELILAGLSDD